MSDKKKTKKSQTTEATASHPEPITAEVTPETDDPIAASLSQTNSETEPEEDKAKNKKKPNPNIEALNFADLRKAIILAIKYSGAFPTIKLLVRVTIGLPVLVVGDLVRSIGRISGNQTIDQAGISLQNRAMGIMSAPIKNWQRDTLTGYNFSQRNKKPEPTPNEANPTTPAANPTAPAANPTTPTNPNPAATTSTSERHSPLVEQERALNAQSQTARPPEQRTTATGQSRSAPVGQSGYPLAQPQTDTKPNPTSTTAQPPAGQRETPHH